MRRRPCSGKSSKAGVSQRATSFTVSIEDNFHAFMDDEPNVLGNFATYPHAAAAAETRVENSLRDLAKPGMTARQLLDAYETFGQAPVIRPPAPTGKSFSAMSYACDAAEAIIAALQNEDVSS
ncbi:hypothetical protein IMZ29_14935 [Achromobacter sp. GG226]|uniref:hypothetical protein n=1 Tax=Verticiella alkaliphila TaxID=2779529 RepID=UPI001C0E20DA|nr:hypothetical protein [Verticiella sp. GG226]MBU4611783.1 hypothetical protein [Verticiella sp. GG226]